MRRAIFTAVALLFVAIGAVAQEHDQSMTMTPIAQEEHLAHLRELLAERSSHGPVIPQPDSVSAAAAKSFTVTARSFDFTISPSPFTVNQGDAVTITLTVPSNDPSTVGHGILMETYVENGVDCPKGQSKQIQFTATTAGTFAFICDIPDCGTGHSLMSGNFTVVKAANPAPTVTSIAPTTGSPSGGTAVTITGTGFLTGATVKFGGTLATNVSVVSATSITATTPAHAGGKVDVVVTNSDSQSATLAQSFTYALPAPTISVVSPATGPTSGLTPVTITGTNFQSGATVTFGTRPATDVTVVSATSITARTPLGPTGAQLAVNVVVTNPDSTTATANNGFTYTVPALTVVSVTPNLAVPNAPVTIAIFGAGFTSVVAPSVTVAGVAATNVQVIDPVTIQATLPSHPAGRGDVVVTAGATSATLTNGFSWQNPPPKRRSVKH
ncbi:MAG TPA: IPT/TIG domain-containing protein [Thermoanaerobaculia bacterium]|nr:IPT/TIG domain-containing protein [Thermoanaerobaculia bacterium]